MIMVHALDQPADRVRGFEAGADDFLTTRSAMGRNRVVADAA